MSTTTATRSTKSPRAARPSSRRSSLRAVAAAGDGLTLVLSSVGNPDFGPYAAVSVSKTVKVSTTAEARTASREYIDSWALGGGNWSNGSGNLLDAHGRVVARVRYNGRVVPSLPRTPEMDSEDLDVRTKALTAHMMAEGAAEFGPTTTAAEIVAAFEARWSSK